MGGRARILERLWRGSAQQWRRQCSTTAAERNAGGEGAAEGTKERAKVKVGDKAELKRTFTREDIEKFAHITGDCNEIHMSKTAAEAAGFGGGPVVHGVLTLGLLSAVMGTVMPGRGTVYMGQEIRFLAPAFAGEEITARAEVLSMHKRKPWVAFVSTSAFAGDKQLVDGKATVYLPWMAPPKQRSQ